MAIEYEFKIGIVGWNTGENSFGATKAYLRWVDKYGSIVVLGPHEVPRTDLDIIIMPGGKDSASWFMGQRPSFVNSDSDQFKEYFMHNTLSAYIKAGIPIWGTCLGFQQIAAYFGSKITQDIAWHPTTDADKRWQPAHEIIFMPEFYTLRDKYIPENPKDKKKPNPWLEVNSLHHQGIMIEDISDELSVITYSKDKVVEMLIHKTLPIGGVQGHPEEDFNFYACYLFESLLLRSPNYLKSKENKKDEKVHN